MFESTQILSLLHYLWLAVLVYNYYFFSLKHSGFIFQKCILGFCFWWGGALGIDNLMSFEHLIVMKNKLKLRIGLIRIFMHVL